MRILFWLVLTALPAFSESTVPQIPNGNQPKLFTEVTFAKGQATIDVFGRQALDQMVREANLRGSIDEVQVISWGDVEYPINNDPVPATEVDLARSRSRAVEDYLNRGRNLSVKTYNMAQKPTALEELVNSSDARMKYSLATAGITDGRGLKKISRSLVVVVLGGN